MLHFIHILYIYSIYKSRVGGSLRILFAVVGVYVTTKEPELELTCSLYVRVVSDLAMWEQERHSCPMG